MVVERCMPSTAIANIAYEQELHRLSITFGRGRVYEYVDVPAEVAASFWAALLKGGFFNGYVRDRYDFRDITPAN